MTINHGFKQRVRARMVEMGENYTTARAALLAQRERARSDNGLTHCQACEVHKDHERCTRSTTLGTQGYCACLCPQATVHRNAVLKGSQR